MAKKAKVRPDPDLRPYSREDLKVLKKIFPGRGGYTCFSCPRKDRPEQKCRNSSETVSEYARKRVNLVVNLSCKAMKKSFFLPCILFLCVLLGATSCDRWEDAGPYDESVAEFGLTNFDGLEMGHAFRVNVYQGNTFRISARGHRPDIADLSVRREDGILKIRFQHGNRNRKYPMDIDVTMPVLRSVDFSGAVKADVTDFEKGDRLIVTLSGASEMRFFGSAKRTDVHLSGASRLELEGYTDRLNADLSGASVLRAFDYPSYEGDFDLSGASDARTTISEYLDADASGASKLRYRGNPRTSLRATGGSTISRD